MWDLHCSRCASADVSRMQPHSALLLAVPLPTVVGWVVWLRCIEHGTRRKGTARAALSSTRSSAGSTRSRAQRSRSACGVVDVPLVQAKCTNSAACSSRAAPQTWTAASTPPPSHRGLWSSRFDGRIGRREMPDQPQQIGARPGDSGFESAKLASDSAMNHANFHPHHGGACSLASPASGRRAESFRIKRPSSYTKRRRVAGSWGRL